MVEGGGRLSGSTSDPIPVRVRKRPDCGAGSFVCPCRPRPRCRFVVQRMGAVMTGTDGPEPSLGLTGDDVPHIPSALEDMVLVLDPSRSEQDTNGDGRAARSSPGPE